jgi:TonB family protein
MNTTARLTALALVLATVTPLSAKDNATSANRPPEIVKSVAPAYPYLMRRSEAQAEVTVAIKVSAKGAVTDVRIVDSNNPEFVAPVLDAVRQWAFKPAIKNGQPAETRVLQTFVFSFRDQPAMGDGKRTLVAGEKR